MNPSIIRQFFARFAQVSQRTRMILIAVFAFGIGTLFAGSGGNGRYVPLYPSDAVFTILDTKTGAAWAFDSHTGGYRRIASFSYF